jgi:molybdopterin/thiamine biosynthesis adenylyltransferase
MRHVAEHINGIYHASIVFSNDFSELDSWFYDRRNDDLVPVKKVLVVGKDRLNVLIPTGVRENNKNLPLRMDRTVKAFGEDAVRMLGYLDIGVVGLSALGLPIFEMLARDGFGSIMGSDPDLVDVTNLNRLIGTTLVDIGKYKADFAADMARKINPDVQVTAFRKSFYEEDVQRAFAQADIFFGCVDSGARFSIDRQANANLIPYFDLGAGILRENGKVTFKGGQVISIIPGREVCLDCSGMFENLKPEFWSPEKRERERNAGYLMDGDQGQPLVAHLDSVIAGLGYHTMLNYIWGQGPDDNYNLYCDMTNNTLIEAASSSDGCMYCRKDGLLGMGDKVSPFVPMEDRDLDIPAVA